jgi:hypothetical protein
VKRLSNKVFKLCLIINIYADKNASKVSVCVSHFDDFVCFIYLCLLWFGTSEGLCGLCLSQPLRRPACVECASIVMT